MLERLIITVLLGALAVAAYWMLNRYQKQQVAVTVQKMDGQGQAKLLYFRSDHCTSCMAQSHYLAQLKAEYQALVQPIDVEKESGLTGQYNILTLPTTILIDGNGGVLHYNPGLTNPGKLTRQLENLRGES